MTDNINEVRERVSVLADWAVIGREHGDAFRALLADHARLQADASPKSGSDAEVALYQVRPRSFPAGEGWREVTERQFNDYGDFPGRPDAEWERRKLCVMQATSAQAQAGDAEVQP